MLIFTSVSATNAPCFKKCVDISDVKTPEEIAERVLTIEHQILPEVVKAFAEDRIIIEDNRVIVLN